MAIREAIGRSDAASFFVANRFDGWIVQAITFPIMPFTGTLSRLCGLLGRYFRVYDFRGE